MDHGTPLKGRSLSGTQENGQDKGYGSHTEPATRSAGRFTSGGDSPPQLQPELNLRRSIPIAFGPRLRVCPAGNPETCRPGVALIPVPGPDHPRKAQASTLPTDPVPDVRCQSGRPVFRTVVMPAELSLQSQPSIPSAQDPHPKGLGGLGGSGGHAHPYPWGEEERRALKLCILLGTQDRGGESGHKESQGRDQAAANGWSSHEGNP